MLYNSVSYPKTFLPFRVTLGDPASNANMSKLSIANTIRASNTSVIISYGALRLPLQSLWHSVLFFSLPASNRIEPEGIPLEPVPTSSGQHDGTSMSSASETEEDRSTDVTKMKRLIRFLLEKDEYRDPATHGWRIKFRRLCLTLGVFFFTYTTLHSTITTQSYSSKREIQKILVTSWRFPDYISYSRTG